MIILGLKLLLLTIILLFVYYCIGGWLAIIVIILGLIITSVADYETTKKLQKDGNGDINDKME